MISIIIKIDKTSSATGTVQSDTAAPTRKRQRACTRAFRPVKRQGTFCCHHAGRKLRDGDMSNGLNPEKTAVLSASLILASTTCVIPTVKGSDSFNGDSQVRANVIPFAR